jgi:DNA-binding NarL/FixJ family response regulator
VPAGTPTDRETEVLRLVAKGLTAKRIGEPLVVPHRTVESHVQNVRDSLRWTRQRPAPVK